MILPLLPPLLLPLYFHVAASRTARPAIAVPDAEQHWMIERQMSERWMHARQRPEFTVPIASHAWWPVSVVAEPGGTRAVTLTSSNRMLGNGRLHVDSSGHVQSTETLPVSARPQASPLFTQSPRDSMRMANVALFDGFGTGILSMPESRLWELVPVFAPKSVRVGARWTDTLALDAVHGAFRQRLHGIRQSEITGDTTVAGRHLWVVHHTAAVHYRERWLDYERTLDSAAVVERIASGTVHGRYLFDDSVRLARASWDTTLLTGTASLAYPDGRTFPTTARFDRTRTLTLYDSAGYQAHEQARRAAEQPFSILVRPKGPLEERLAAGDSVLRDSLEREWKSAKDPSRRAFLFHTISMWGANQRTRDRLQALSFAAGDTVSHLREMRNMVWANKLDVKSLEFLLPFMSDPGLLFAFGQERDVFYENIGGGMINRPPALLADSALWPCIPAACRMLADQWRTAREPRLREVALMAHFALEPRQWKDSMEAHALKGGVASSALNLIRGIGATWPAASKQTIPPVDAPWPVWLEWMSGTNPKDAQTRNSPFPAVGFAGRVRFEDTHAHAIQMQELLTGRNVTDELQRGYAAGGDTARYVFGVMLQAMNKLTPDASQIATALEGPATSLDRTLATRSVTAAFRNATRADSALSVALTDTLLSMLVARAPQWSYLNDDQGRRLLFAQYNTGTAPVVVRSAQLPEAVAARWKGRVPLVSDPHWRVTKELYPVMVFELSPVDVAGPMARMTVNWVLETTQPEAGGFTVYLLRTATGWKIVTVSEWIA